MITGGGNIGHRLARTLESRYKVKIIERNRDRCIELSESLDRTIVLQGMRPTRICCRKRISRIRTYSVR